jgi:hypothetical protein
MVYDKSTWLSLRAAKFFYWGEQVVKNEMLHRTIDKKVASQFFANPQCYYPQTTVMKK